MFRACDKRDARRFLQDLAGRGVRVEVTELDARLALFADATDPHQAQGENLGGWVKACASVRGCDAVTLWGNSDATAWVLGPAGPS